ncbi:GIY-YIG nuclease family protein [Rubritalea tangerina]|uniref:GIY-YIG nuclease family protein n=1 Tax=Rubritalea tangerina TaxID=430798 RepID=A0ABW4Z833_9BACT
MTSHAKTIQIFLPDGNPRGLKIAEFTSRTIKTILVPRTQLDLALKREELGNVGVYFLFGDTTPGKLTQLYIGEAEDCSTRLKQHNKQKDWWNVAVVCISKTQEFTKAHVKYLEWYCHQQAEASGRYKLENGNIPPKAHVSEPVIADLMDHFESISTLTSTLGYPLFDKPTKPKRSEKLTCKGKKALAHGEYTDDGLTVFAGSTTNKNFTKSSHNYIQVYRDGLLEDGILIPGENPDTYQFTKNHTFNSPSLAAAVLLASNSNGWVEWKYPDGKTLDEVKRKNS